MMKGFGEQPGRTRHKDWADKSLQKTTRELKMLREVIEKYKDDPDGRHKMLKKMKRLWNSPIQTVRDLDMKPTGKNVVDELREVNYDEMVEDYREEVGIDSPHDPVDTTTDESENIRNYLEGK